MADDDPTPNHWHLDKRVPLAFIGAIGIQTLIAVWWAASFSAGLQARLDYVERQVAVVAPQGGQIIRLETKVDSLNENIIELKNTLKQWRP